MGWRPRLYTRSPLLYLITAAAGVDWRSSRQCLCKIDACLTPRQVRTSVSCVFKTCATTAAPAGRVESEDRNVPDVPLVRLPISPLRLCGCIRCDADDNATAPASGRSWAARLSMSGQFLFR